MSPPSPPPASDNVWPLCPISVLLHGHSGPVPTAHTLTERSVDGPAKHGAWTPLECPHPARAQPAPAPARGVPTPLHAPCPPMSLVQSPSRPPSRPPSRRPSRRRGSLAHWPQAAQLRRRHRPHGRPGPQSLPHKTLHPLPMLVAASSGPSLAAGRGRPRSAPQQRRAPRWRLCCASCARPLFILVSSRLGRERSPWASLGLRRSLCPREPLPQSGQWSLLVRRCFQARWPSVGLQLPVFPGFLSLRETWSAGHGPVCAVPNENVSTISNFIAAVAMVPQVLAAAARSRRVIPDVHGI